MKILVGLAALVSLAAGAISGPAYGLSNAYSTPPYDYFEVRRPYSFSYKVRDPKSYSDYGHEERSDGHSIHGSYHVALPDGRTQTVTYTADRNGYFPVVKYQGEAKHPDPPRPTYPPAYSSVYPPAYSSVYPPAYSSVYPPSYSSSSSPTSSYSSTYPTAHYASYSSSQTSYPSADIATYASTSSAYRGPSNSLTSYDASYPPAKEVPPAYYPQSVGTAGSYNKDPPVSHSSGVNELPSYVVSSSPSPVPMTAAPPASTASQSSPAYRGLHYSAMPVYVIQSQVYQTPRYGTLQSHSSSNDDNNQLASSYYYPKAAGTTSEIPTLYYPLTASAAATHYPNCPAGKHYHVTY